MNIGLYTVILGGHFMKHSQEWMSFMKQSVSNEYMHTLILGDVSQNVPQNQYTQYHIHLKHTVS